MQVENLASLPPGGMIEADLVIIGAGAAGLTVAREFFNTQTRVLVLESGLLQEDEGYSKLNEVESVGEPGSQAQTDRRTAFHGTSSTSWSAETQGFGVRCRVFGGSTHAWAGKSAAFDEIDFSPRPWAPGSGWPFARSVLDPYLDRAARALNLGPNIYDERLWALIGVDPPQPQFDRDVLSTYFWQFARSRIDSLDVLRVGPEFLRDLTPNVRILLNATVTAIDTDPSARGFQGLQISTIEGARSRVQARLAVLAAGAIENPRLLLASNQVQANGLGNQNDLVGRFLMDHPGARLGTFRAKDCAPIQKRFGFYAVRGEGGVHMYMHGLACSKPLQDREELLNCALYMMEQRAPDDPWDALKRLLRGRSDHPARDLLALAASPGLLAKGVGMQVLRSSAAPKPLKELMVQAAIRLNPSFVAREYQARGLPHKLTGIAIEGVTEQAPDPDSRVTLSDRRDRLGIPLARANWRLRDDAGRSLARLGRALAGELSRTGLPVPALEDWVTGGSSRDAAFIDMGHTLGTTRMASDPSRGVVDPDGRVHGVDGLYVAGGSVFPTSGHANPTLMIVALAVRLADRLKADLALSRAA